MRKLLPFETRAKAHYSHRTWRFYWEWLKRVTIVNFGRKQCEKKIGTLLFLDSKGIFFFKSGHLAKPKVASINLFKGS